MVDGGTLFEELGFYYVGPIDGHNLDHLLPVLKNVRDMRDRPDPGPCRDQEGQGLRARPKPPPTSITASSSSTSSPARRPRPSRTRRPTRTCSAESLVKEAEKDDKIVAHHRRDAVGHRPRPVRQGVPDRTFDVGIAEQHAVTFAAGLATEGYKPFCAIYSTFLQRGYDQVVHDVAIQNLPVRFAIDRAGLVGADGATHAGSFDIAYLGCLPNFVVMAAADEAELVHMVAHRGRDRRPARSRCAIRAAKARGVEMPEVGVAARDRQGPHRARGQQGRDPVVRHAAGRSAEGRRRARRARACRPPSPTRASPSRSTTS